MSNMSYCRFENTANDLRDCREALENLLGGEEPALSESELRCAKDLAETCLEVVLMLAEAAQVDLDDLDNGDAEKHLRTVIDVANTTAARADAEEKEAAR